MAGIPPGRFPSPNPKYQFVGKNYQQHGELQGYRYNPYTDKYSVDPQAAQNMGLLPKDPEPPGLLDQVLPIAVGVGGAAAAKEGGAALGGLLSGGFGGGGAATGTTAATTSGAGGAVAAPTGVMGTSGGSALSPGATPVSGGMLSAGTLVPIAGVGAGLLAGAKGVKDLLNGEDGTDSWEGLAGRATLGIATGGLSEVARLTGIMGHKSTKDYQKERWSKLSPSWQGLKQANHPDADTGVWSSGKYAGEKWSFDKAKDLAKDDPTHFQGVLGNGEVFGDDWFSLSDEQQKAVVSQLVAEDAYTSDKGDVLIHKDKQGRAREIFEQVKSGQMPTTTVETTVPESNKFAGTGDVALPKVGGLLSGYNGQPNDAGFANANPQSIMNQGLLAAGSGRNPGVGGPGMDWNEEKQAYVVRRQ